MSSLSAVDGSNTNTSVLSKVRFVSTCAYGHDFDVLLDDVVVASVSEDIWSEKSCWDVVIGQECHSFCAKEEAFEFARSQFTSTHKQVQIELENYLDQQAEELAPEFEVDSDVDPEFGELFRVWKSCHFIGSFYQSLDGYWVAQPAQGVFRPRLKSDEQAQLVIIAFHYCRQTI